MLAYFIAPYSDDFTTALHKASAGSLVLIVALSVASLLLRTEMWGVSLSAARHKTRRSHLHAANAATYLAALASYYAGSWVRIFVLRKIKGPRAAKIIKLLTVDVAATILEGLFASALIIFAAFYLGLEWWIPVALTGGAMLALAVAVAAHKRYKNHPAIAGLGLLMRPDYRGKAILIITLVFVSQILRVYVALHIVGIHPTILNATLIFVTTGILGLLPSGIAAAPTAASILVLGHKGVGVAAAAGVFLSSSLVFATLIYSACVALIYFGIARRDSQVVAAPIPNGSARKTP